MTGDRRLITGPFVACRRPVRGIVAGLVAEGYGRGVVNGVVVEKLWYVPGMQDTLISVSGLVDQGYKVVAEMVGGVNMMKVVGAESRGGVYFIPRRTQGGYDGGVLDGHDGDGGNGDDDGGGDDGDGGDGGGGEGGGEGDGGDGGGDGVGMGTWRMLPECTQEAPRWRTRCIKGVGTSPGPTCAGRRG